MASTINSQWLYEFRVRRRHARFDQEFATSHWYRPDNVPGAGAVTTDFTALQALASHYALTVLPNTGDDMIYIGYELRGFSGRTLVVDDPTTVPPKTHFKLTGASKASRYNPAAPPDQGGVQMAAQEYLPAYASCGLLVRTDIPLRGAHPTIRFGPIPEFHQADGIILGIEHPKYETIADFYQDPVPVGVEGIVMTPVVFTKTRFLTDEALVGGIRLYNYNIVDVRAQQKLGTQGSRKSPASKIGD